LGYFEIVTNRPHPKKDKNRNYAPLFTYLKVCFALIYSLTIFWTIKRGAEYLLLTSTYPGSVLPSTTGYESLSCDGIISPTNADLRIGEQVTFTATPGGGSGDFKYYWGIDPLAGYFDTTDLGLDSRDPSATWHANYSVIQDNYSIRVEIIDQETKEKCTARAPITISARQDLSCEGALSPTNISLKENETVTFTANPQGGTGYYKYFWGIIPTEGYFTGSTPSSSPSTTWHAPQIDQDSKTYTLWLELYDKVSGVNCKTETLQNGDGGNGKSGVLPSGLRRYYFTPIYRAEHRRKTRIYPLRFGGQRKLCFLGNDVSPIRVLHVLR